MKRTSITHPLQIAAIPAGPGLGQVGITLCPGKHDPYGISGYWDRDLNLDLDAIRSWEAAAVITLVTDQELVRFRVPQLGKEVRRRGMEWFHLPITDGSTPDEGFEREWAIAGDKIRGLLLSGKNVLVHCRGGLGRAGTIGARLLVEHGTDPANAIKRVRAVRRGAIETSAQEKYVLRMRPVMR